MRSVFSLALPAMDAPAGRAVAPWVRQLLFAGVAWLVVGMAVMPAGASYNPGKAYQYVLGLTLYLPALILLVMRPSCGRELWRQPLMPWTFALLGWSLLSLAWSHAPRPADEAGHSVSIVFFLIAWQQGVALGQERIRSLLVGMSLALAVVAVVAIAWSFLHPEIDGRISGFGVMDNANLAAAAMGAALIWLWPWRIQPRALRIAKWLAIAVLAAFVLLTYTRSAWGALLAGFLAMVLCRGGRRAWFSAGAALLVAGVAVVVNLPLLLERGLSMRPQIFEQAWALFLQHPLRGRGMGNAFHFYLGPDLYTHVHNLFSQLAVELGLVGLLMWSGIWLALGWRAWLHRDSTLGQVVVGLWVFGMVMVQFDQPHLVDSPRPGWLLTWLPLALSLSLGRWKETA
ncbi:O-antigen ligase domain-containing protein [Dyella solisilvae]|uniref:O-antigen ligase domain-containing protein n=1 Tax=Dyella solisilvae TaxID=1920168 RepID=A0A370K8L7_9GAMM|nr:O-antigen ligase family protein [Dyella solisilvae]RDI98985.1 O-antigen ligase domain-containing protein [Dyella solisilvae]